VVLYERDDAIAVPLLSQIRLAGFDVRAARTPVELFDILSKHLVSLVLVDLGNATAGRREFWVALDAQRRGRTLQVMTFRYTTPGGILDSDFEPAGRAVADVEVRGAQEFPLIVDGLRQRVPLQGTPELGASGMSPMGALSGASPYGMPAQMGQGFGTPYGQPPAGYAPGFAVPGAPPSDPYALSPGQVSPFAPAPAFNPSPFGPSPFGASPFGVAPAASPFAHPVEANPFAVDARSSAFAQPLSANPFTADAPPTDAPFGGPTLRQPAVNPFETPAGAYGQPAAARFGDPQFEERAARLSADYAAQFNISEATAARPPYVGASPFESSPLEFSPPHTWEASRVQPAPGDNFAGYGGAYRAPAERPSAAHITDAWTPPEGDFDGETGVVPELAYAPIDGPSRAGAYPQPGAPGHESGAQRDGMPRDFAGFHAPAFDTHSFDALRPAHLAQQQTAPVPAPSHLPAVRTGTPTERALGNVLVEGALLSPQKLDALRGIQQMLASVDLSFKLGELALLFKFLSPDQLLAALLVSRGYVSPQQIAGLGRVKQELSASGMDYDLETLLGMFHILSPEQLRQIRAELG
jgi:hypothetical protein